MKTQVKSPIRALIVPKFASELILIIDVDSWIIFIIIIHVAWQLKK